jgi:hypothetical protein
MSTVVVDRVESIAVSVQYPTPVPETVILRLKQRSVMENVVEVTLSGEQALRLRDDLDRYLPPRGVPDAR